MWDELYARERELQAAAAATRPAAPEPEPGFWRGVAKATGAGIMSGGAKAAQLVGVAGSVIPIAADTFLGADNLTGESLADGYFRRLDEITSRAVEYWSLPADGVGAAGRILHGVGEMALPLMATGGNPALFAASQGMNTGMEMVRKGVDADTAGALAMVNTAAAGAGMMIPAAMGASRAMSAAIGAIVNPTMGVADRAATRAILEHQNYPAIAAQYRPFDPEAMATEAIIGGIFGTLFHGAGPKEGKDKRPLTPDEQAALLTKIHADTREADTLAKPGDIAAQNAGREAQALAMAQIDAGQPVSVAHLVAADAPTVEAARGMAFERLTERMRAELTAEAGNRAEPGEVPRMKQERAEIGRELERLQSEQAFKEEAKAQQRQGFSRKEAESAARKSLADQVADLESRAQRLDNQIETNRRAAQAEQDLAALNRGEIPARFAGAVEDAAQGIVRGMQERPIAQAMRSMFERRPEVAGKPEAPKGEPRGEPRGEPAQAMADALAHAAPDRTIRIQDADGAIRDVKTSDLMAEMEREFRNDIQDAKAFEAAATCFLMTGAAV